MAPTNRRLLDFPIAAALCLCTGCDPGPIELAEVEDRAPAGTGSVHVRVTASPGSGLSADATGGATIYFARTHSKGFPWDSVKTDQAGSATLRDLAAGLYWVAARGADHASGAGEKIRLVAGDSLSVDLPLFPSRAESLVISEFYGSAPPPWIVVTRGESKYLELYNNSRSVVFLDGLLVGQFYSPFFDGGTYNHSRCSVTEPYRNDPTALWSDVVWKFPGTGSSYPVSPGETVLIAVSAADHRTKHESFLDLTGADFEFLLDAGGADNPAVPNMIQAGTRPSRFNDFFLTQVEWFLAYSFDTEAAPRIITPDPHPDVGYRETYLRVPAEVVMDAAMLWWDKLGQYSPGAVLPYCNDPIAPNFDRLPGGFQPPDALTISIQRLAGPNRTLLDTGVSRIDFHYRERTPGWVPR